MVGTDGSRWVGGAGPIARWVRGGIADSQEGTGVGAMAAIMAHLRLVTTR